VGGPPGRPRPPATGWRPPNDRDASKGLLAAMIGVLVVTGCAHGASRSPSSAGDAAVGSSPSTGPLTPQSGSTTSLPRPLLIDTDVAPDDLVAIAFLLASPGVEIRAITVSGTGEAHCGAGVDVVLRLLERLDAPAIDVACGRETPTGGDHAFPDAWRERVDGGSGLDLPSTSRRPFAGDAVQLILQAGEGADGLRVLTLGPLTNLADALTRHPDLADRVESIYAMGGALFVPGNVRFGGPPDNAVAEWNIYVDPAAAQAVIDSGLPVRLVSLDGTNQVPVTPEYAQRVVDDATGPGALLLAEFFAASPLMTDGTYFLWDPLAAALAAGHPLGSFRAARVEVDEAEGPEVGFTRPVEGSPNVEYLNSVDRAAAEDALLETLNQARFQR
jgi:inosine-uridine nucleoside N-ribohydrolase